MDDARIAEIRLRSTTFAEEWERNCLAPADIRDLLADNEALRSLALRQHEMLEGMEEDGNGECLVCGQPSDRHHAGCRYVAIQAEGRKTLGVA